MKSTSNAVVWSLHLMLLYEVYI